jgi:hypothetical protein
VLSKEETFLWGVRKGKCRSHRQIFVVLTRKKGRGEQNMPHSISCFDGAGEEALQAMPLSLG